MIQDQIRWRNQNFVTTVYKDIENGSHTVECIHIDRPHERAYLELPSLKVTDGFYTYEMRGNDLRNYIDSQLRIFEKDSGD